MRLCEFPSLVSSLTPSARTGSETRRQAASDFTRALMEQFEAQVTQIVTQYIGAYLQVRKAVCVSLSLPLTLLTLQQYASSPQGHWKSKDTAIFLLTSIATRGSTQQQGVTSTNALVDVIKFFSDHVLADLQAAPGAVHPIVQADAIKFLYTFRMQVRLAPAAARSCDHADLVSHASSRRSSFSPSFPFSFRTSRTLLSSFTPTLPSRSSASSSSSRTTRSCASRRASR